jgi:hypothetical protein
VGLSIQISGLSQLERKLHAARDAFQKDAQQRMALALTAIESQLLVTLRAPRPKASGLLEPGGIGGLGVRQHGARTLTQTLVKSAVWTGTKLIGSVGSPVFWLSVHEYGKRIVAKGKALRIPTVNYYAPRSFAVVDQRGRKSYPKFLFVKSVNIPKRAPFATAAGRAEGQVRELLGSSAREFVRVFNATQ